MAEAKAAEKEAAKKKSPLQTLAVTASDIEVVEPLTASNNEVWPPAPLQTLKQGKTPKNGRKANNSGGLKHPGDISDSESHASNIAEFLILLSLTK